MFTRDIVAYNDVELDQYLEANGRFVKVEDPENLMRDKDFIQRLRARTGASDLAQSPPIDLNHVSARLGKIPLDGETSPRYPSPATTLSIDEEEEYQR
ncbi:hypothetical protein MMC06_005066, partial [Schaereria dolodes]|nr:hypothetical protein [Schaereria dolodes]